MQSSKKNLSDLEFTDNLAIASRRDHYCDITVDVKKILKSWQSSLYSYEWMHPDGRIKSRDELTAAEQPKRDEAETLIRECRPLVKPVLGIGILENVEIGSGRAIFLTLAANGCQTIPVHIPHSNRDEFTSFLA